MPGNGHVRCGGRARETGRAESRHRALVRSHVTLIHDTSRGLPRTVNNLCVASLIAACAAGHAIADQAAARSAITEVTATP
jgi:type II secretory pathway predicted ATPase ExeA